jgi:hypothetical protein
MTAIAFAASFERKFSKKESEEKDPDAQFFVSQN